MPTLALTTPFQPSLFGDDLALLDAAEETKRRAAKSTVEKLRKLRRSLETAETVFSPYLDDCILAIRCFARQSENQLREIVLYSIEVQGAGTLSEIAEECKMQKGFTQNLLNAMIGDDDIYTVPRFSVGLEKPLIIYKSSRRRTPEFAVVRGRTA